MRLGRGTSLMMPLVMPATFVTLWWELPGPLPMHWNMIWFLFLSWLRARLLVTQVFLLPPIGIMTLRLALKFLA